MIKIGNILTTMIIITLIILIQIIIMTIKLTATLII